MRKTYLHPIPGLRLDRAERPLLSNWAHPPETDTMQNQSKLPYMRSDPPNPFSIPHAHNQSYTIPVCMTSKVPTFSWPSPYIPPTARTSLGLPEWCTKPLQNSTLTKLLHLEKKRVQGWPNSLIAQAETSAAIHRVPKNPCEPRIKVRSKAKKEKRKGTSSSGSTSRETMRSSAVNTVSFIVSGIHKRGKGWWRRRECRWATTYKRSLVQ